MTQEREEHADVMRLRQGLWDVYAILGFDTDGDKTRITLVSDIVSLVVNAAKEFRQDYEEALAQPASVPAGFVCVERGLIEDAIESIKDYQAGVDFGSSDRKLIGALKAALAAAPAAPQPAQADQATAPAPETDDKPKSTAYERDLELLIHDFVRCSLVGTPSEATLHQLDRLIELVAHPTINRNLKSMRRQVMNPRPPCPPFTSRRPSGAEIEAPAVEAAPQPEAQPQHPDDIAVNSFASAMKAKLAAARDKGRHGWQECSQADLTEMLHEHVAKGDPRDVANFCMFLWSLGYGIKPLSGMSYTESMAFAEGFQTGYKRAAPSAQAEQDASECNVSAQGSGQ